VASRQKQRDTDCSIFAPLIRESVSAVRSRGASLLRSAPGFVLLAIALADVMRYADTDLWGHIHFGSIVLSQHRLFFHAPSSYACPAGPNDWIMVDWLGEMLMALVYNVAGIIGLKLAKFACVAAVIVLLSMGAEETGASLEVQTLVLFITALALIPHMQFRTFLADDVFIAALSALLARESYTGGAPLWLVVPILALWVNLHGGFFVGLMAMGIYTAVRAAQDVLQGREMRRTVRIAALTSAATLVTLANPYGIRDWIVVLNVLRNPFTLQNISEFRPLLAVISEFYQSNRPLFTLGSAVAIMVTLLVNFVFTPRADDFALFLIAATMGFTALYAVRNTALAVIACSIPLCRHAGLLFDRIGSAGPAKKLFAVHTWRTVQALVAVAAIGVLILTGLLSKTLPAVELKPTGALIFMKEHNLHGNVLCEFGWADYLIFHDAPRSRIFIESIFEAYYPRSLQSDFAAVHNALPGAARVLNEYPNDFVLMPTGSPIYGLMMAQTGWRLIYRDPTATLFARADSSAVHLLGVPLLMKTAAPSVFP
jgi:hypothetical protein